MNTRREGMSLVEVIVALIILSVGILAMGASTGYVLTQVKSAELRTDRLTAARQVAERLRGVAWADLEQECASGPFTADDHHYAVACTVTLVPGALNLKQVQLITRGPGFSAGRIVPTVTDTMTIAIARPAI